MQCNTVMIDCKQSKPVRLCIGCETSLWYSGADMPRSLYNTNIGKNFILSDLSSTLSKTKKWKNHPKHMEWIAFIEPVLKHTEHWHLPIQRQHSDQDVMI